MIPLAPRSALFPYTTLFRSLARFLARSFALWRFPAFLPLSGRVAGDRKSTRLNSSHVASSYAVFCLKKKKYQVATGSHTQIVPTAPARGMSLTISNDGNYVY